ncbi:hypothetical protein ACPPVQ_17340 [Diaminobutyricibacter sp. McL0618]|uniref:hypothetical protein n=1 Tax=Leifsonia sp. McL0618 TaxID=3415677 RepID=UPI003CE99484
MRALLPAVFRAVIPAYQVVPIGTSTCTRSPSLQGGTLPPTHAQGEYRHRLVAHHQATLACPHLEHTASRSDRSHSGDGGPQQSEDESSHSRYRRVSACPGRSSRGRPLPGHGPHLYRFHLYALDTHIDLTAVPDAEHLPAAMKGHVLASGTLSGTRQS